MRGARSWVGVALLLSTGLGVYGCGDSPTSVVPEEEVQLPPVRGPSFARVGGVTLGVLRWSEDLPADLTESRWIGPKGGRVKLNSPGVSLVVPRGALGNPGGRGSGRSGSVRITMTLHEGGGVSVGFGPHGLQFSKPAYLVIDLKDTEAANNRALLRGLVAVYFEGEPGQTVEGQETLPVLVVRGKLIVRIPHFSGYLLASG